MTKKLGVFSREWLAIWSVFTSIGWLLPNHYVPWVAFHFDAWISGGLLIVGWVVFVRTSKPIALHRLAVVCALVAAIPFLQYGFGLLAYVGQAWIGAAFVFGFMIAMIVGAHWETNCPGQAADGLFMAIGIAALVSVGLQLYQWLGLTVESLDLWVMAASPTRPFANFIQPNQLATFLVWALLGCAWGVVRGQIGFHVSMIASIFLLTGVALTKSRAAFFAIIAVSLSAFLWRRFWPQRRVIWSVTALSLYYFSAVYFLPKIATILYLDAGNSMADLASSQARITAYRLFLDAILERPAWGYGWAQTAAAQLALADVHPRLGGIFMQAHNLVIDLILWCGIPVGGAIVVVLLSWFIGKIKLVNNSENTILLMVVVVVSWHAMLELPLHYAYFLFPIGFVIGILNNRLLEPTIVFIDKRWAMVVVGVATVFLLLITRDYFRVEKNFYVLRFERAKIGAPPAEPMLNVLLLDHMNEFVKMGRTKASENMSLGDLDEMRKAAHAYPSLGNLYTLSIALAWNQRAEEAQRLVNKLAKISSDQEYAQMRRIWLDSSRFDARLALIAWKNDDEPDGN